MSVGQRLKVIKKTLRLNQGEFAELLNVSTTTVSSYYNDKNKPGFDSIVRMLEKYPQINVNWLLFGTGEMYGDIRKEKGSAKNQINTYGKNNTIGSVNSVSSGGDVSISNSSDSIYKGGKVTLEEKDAEIERLRIINEELQGKVNYLQGQVDLLKGILSK